MIGCSETLERIDRALMTGEAFVRLYDEYRFPVATADEQVATQKGVSCFVPLSAKRRTPYLLD